MNYQGVIIEESLQDAGIMKELKTVSTKIEPITPRHKTPWLKQWTLRTVEIPENKAEYFANKLSQLFDINHPDWYIDYKNTLYHFIIYPNKVFKVDLQNPAQYHDAKLYGLSIGIPDYQLPFPPQD